AGEAPPPVSGAASGNYFDHLDDFLRDTHNCVRRARMIFMEFTNLGADSDPTFFRKSAGELLSEVKEYQAVAAKMHNGKLQELLDEIAGVLDSISHVDKSNQMQIVTDVKATLDLTGLAAKLELLDSGTDRSLGGPPNA
ncbi:MAG TPA: hypothetical protein VNI57_14820, partial [Candidatus Saccharimonadales bacterium]|nr:hypothetical protein [Candidatus Saccharimonadales bacterium]